MTTKTTLPKKPQIRNSVSYSSSAKLAPDYRLIQAEKNIQLITVNDRSLYNRFFKSDNRFCSYGNSWTYITQACRRIVDGRLKDYCFGLRYLNGNRLYSIGRHNSHFVVVRPLGELDNHFVDLLNLLVELSGHPVFLKKIYEDQADILREKIQLLTPEHYPWHKDEIADDDTYPEVIVDIPQFLSCWEESHGARIRTFRNRVHRFQQFRSTEDIEDISYRPNGRHGNSVASWHSSLRSAIQIHFKEDPHFVEAYLNMMSVLPLGAEGVDYFSTVSHEKFVIRAFFLAERLGDQEAGLYAAIAVRNYPGCSDHMHLSFLRKLASKGIRYLNMGGSEIETLWEYKRKFHSTTHPRFQVPGMFVYKP